MVATACSIDGCAKPARKRGWCETHYWRFRQHGDPNVALKPWGKTPRRPRASEPRWTPTERRCGHCDTAFTPTARHQRYCTRRCKVRAGCRRQNARRRRPQLKVERYQLEVIKVAVCPICREFFRQGLGRRYCGMECARSAKLNHDRERQASLRPAVPRARWLDLTRGFIGAVRGTAYAAHLLGDPCSYCGGPADQRDHIVPRALGGGQRTSTGYIAAEILNLTAACEDCNRSKGDQPFLLWLLSTPHWPAPCPAPA